MQTLSVDQVVQEWLQEQERKQREAERLVGEEEERRRDARYVVMVESEGMREVFDSIPKDSAPKALENWKKLKRLDCGSVLRQSTMADLNQDLEEGEVPELKTEAFWWGYRSGFHKKGTDKLCGLGRKVHKEGSILEGMFRNGNLHGYGRRLWQNGDCYSGLFHDGKMHGRGSFVGADGKRLDGHWAEGGFKGAE